MRVSPHALTGERTICANDCRIGRPAIAIWAGLQEKTAIPPRVNILATILETWRLALAVVLSHPAVFWLTFIVLGALAGLKPARPDGVSGFVQMAMTVLAMLPLTLLAHRLVLNGESSFRDAIGTKRIGLYVLDLALFAVLLITVILVPTVILVLAIGDATESVIFGAAFVVALAVLARYGLTFPARAIDVSVPWGKLLAAGEGKTLAMMVTIFVSGLPGLALGLAQLAFPSDSVAAAALGSLQTLVSCTIWSVCASLLYRQLLPSPVEIQTEDAPS